MRMHFLVPLVAAAANVVIAALVLRQGLRERLRRVFAWLTLCIALWNLDIFALYYFADEARAEWWSRAFRTGMFFVPAATLHLTLLFGAWRAGFWKAALWVGYAIGALLAVLNAKGMLVAQLSPHAWGWYIEPTPLYALTTAAMLAYLPLSMVCAWQAYRHPTSPRQRVQAKFWFLGVGVQVPLGLTNLLPAYGVEFYPLGNLGNVFAMGVIAYAIARHRLMDVDHVVRKGVSFSLAAGLVLVPGALAVAAYAGASGSSDPQLIGLATLAFGLAAAVLVPALQAGIETRLQQAFFPHLRDYRRRLADFANALVHILDQSELARRLGHGLNDILDPVVCRVFLREPDSGKLVGAYPDHVREVLDDSVVRLLERLTAPALATELPTEAGVVFRRFEWEVVIPLHIKERLTGFVVMGRKRNLDIYSVEDLRLLGAIGSAASVALENANLSRQLRRSEAVLEHANRLSSLGVLAAGIAHEIRNPLVAVKTFLDLLPQRLDDREFLTRFRDLSLSELRRVTDLIADLLALGKSAAAERRAVEIEETLEPVLRLMESTARKRRVTLAVDPAAGLPPVWADPDQLKQIVLNLLLNAIDASPPDGVVHLGLRPAGPTGLVLEVRDQGPGIPAPQMEHIFDPFFTTKETGTGLGLPLVRQMVLEHGGEIAVESEPGRGTTFRVTLPAAQVPLARTGS